MTLPNIGVKRSAKLLDVRKAYGEIHNIHQLIILIAEKEVGDTVKKAYDAGMFSFQPIDAADVPLPSSEGSTEKDDESGDHQLGGPESDTMQDDTVVDTHNMDDRDPPTLEAFGDDGKETMTFARHEAEMTLQKLEYEQIVKEQSEMFAQERKLLLAELEQERAKRINERQHFDRELERIKIAQQENEDITRAVFGEKMKKQRQLMMDTTTRYEQLLSEERREKECLRQKLQRTNDNQSDSEPAFLASEDKSPKAAVSPCVASASTIEVMRTMLESHRRDFERRLQDIESKYSRKSGGESAVSGFGQPVNHSTPKDVRERDQATDVTGFTRGVVDDHRYVPRTTSSYSRKEGNSRPQRSRSDNHSRHEKVQPDFDGVSSSEEERMETRQSRRRKGAERPSDRDYWSERQSRGSTTTYEDHRTKIPEYDGNARWNAYRMQFEGAMVLRRIVDPETKRVLLVNALRGKALNHFDQVPTVVKLDYDRLCQALKTRFDIRKRPEVARSELSEIHQLEGESVEAFAARCQALASEGYPGEMSVMADTATIEALLKGVTDSFVGQLIQSAGLPTSVQDAIDKIKQGASAFKKAGKKVRAVSFPEEKTTDTRTGVLTEDDMERIVSKLRSYKINGRSQSPYPGRRSNNSSNAGSRSQSPGRTLGPCFNCNKMGHLAKECPKKSEKAEN